jgi:surface protein
MRYMFYGASSFDQPLNEWNTGQVVTMRYMFYGASSFNQPLNDWNTGRVVTMIYMFYGASSFNQPLNDWNTGQVVSTGFQYMFRWDAAWHKTFELIDDTGATPSDDGPPSLWQPKVQ